MLDWSRGKILKSYNLKYSKMHCAQCGINIAAENHYWFACGARKLVNYDLRDESDFIENFQMRFQVWVDVSLIRYSSQKQNEFVHFEEACREGNRTMSVLHGYRSMWNKLRTTYNIIASRDSVMEIPREVDPLRTSERRSRNLERIAQMNLGMSMDTSN